MTARAPIVAVLLAGSGALAGERFDVRLVDVAREAGVTLVNLCGERQKRFIVEVNGNGAAFFDYDDDGDQDLLLTNGSTLELIERGGSPLAALYRNRGGGRFDDATAASGLVAHGWGVGACVADYDNDGDRDVYVTAYGPNRLFRNLGDGSFRETSGPAGVDDGRYGTGCSFVDYDRDGYVDLYVANYLTFDRGTAEKRDLAPNCQFMGVSVMCGPRHFAGEADVLFRNLGDGTFTDVTREAGVEDPGYYGFGVISGDLDDDGWQDIYVANDSRPNFFFKSNGDGTFTETALVAGLALDQGGREQAGMGVDIGDVDNDGRLDVFVTNFSHETNTLYRGGAEGVYTDVTYPSGLGGPSLSYLGWGTGLVDLDNDGFLDVFIANGHVYPEVDDFPLGTTFAERKQLFQNLRDGSFREITEDVGGDLLRDSSSRGVAFADYDDDGDLDIAVVNLDDAPTLLRNDGGNRNGWLGLRLVGARANRDAVGARVMLESAGSTQIREVRSGGSYLSHNDARLHFGLGAEHRVHKVLIRWPAGALETYEEFELDSYSTVLEGRGVVVSRPTR